MLSRESGDNITKQGHHGYHEYHSVERQRFSVVAIENDGYQWIPRFGSEFGLQMDSTGRGLIEGKASKSLRNMVARDGIEPPTPAFSAATPKLEGAQHPADGAIQVGSPSLR